MLGYKAVRMVACGGDHTLVVTRTGALFAFGKGANGQLGLGSTSNIDLPAEVRYRAYSEQTRRLLKLHKRV